MSSADKGFADLHTYDDDVNRRDPPMSPEAESPEYADVSDDDRQFGLVAALLIAVPLGVLVWGIIIWLLV